LYVSWYLCLKHCKGNKFRYITQNNQNKKLSQRYVMVWNNNVNMDLFNAPTPFGDEVAKT
jgi:hypothetical protein